MQPERTARLSAPEGTLVIPANADLYELDFSPQQARIAREGDDLAFIFPHGQIILRGFHERSRQPRFIVGCDFLSAPKKGAWMRVPGHPGIYSRDAGGCREYQLRQMVGGRRFTDFLGAVTLDEAARLAERLRAGRSGPAREATAPRDWTVGEFRKERYLSHRENLARSEADSRLMAGRWKNHIEAWFGSRRLSSLAETDFEEYAAWLRSSKAFGDTTVLHCLADLRKIWAYALKLKVVDRPFPGTDAIREVARVLDNEKHCSLERDEAKELVAVAYGRRLRGRSDHDVWCYIVLGLGLGMRAGEISRLTRQDVERHIIGNTKNRRSRFVHFDFAPVRDMLEERLRLYPPGSPDEPLFRTFAKNAARSVRHAAPKKYYHLIAELGFNETDRRRGNRLERIDFHALRHTFATFAAMAGVGHLDLMRLMGHRTPAMTLRYVQMTDARHAECQEMAMAGIFPERLKEFSAGFPT